MATGRRSTPTGSEVAFMMAVLVSVSVRVIPGNGGIAYNPQDIASPLEYAGYEG